VPIQAVVERNGLHYCARRSGSIVEVRKVEVGSTNEKFAVILSGLAEGDEVSMNPRPRLDAELPEVAAKTARKEEASPKSDQLAAPHVPAGSGAVGP
jgi:hypothetical protein